MSRSENSSLRTPKTQKDGQRAKTIHRCGEILSLYQSHAWRCSKRRPDSQTLHGTIMYKKFMTPKPTCRMRCGHTKVPGESYSVVGLEGLAHGTIARIPSTRNGRDLYLFGHSRMGMESRRFRCWNENRVSKQARIWRFHSDSGMRICFQTNGRRES